MTVEVDTVETASSIAALIGLIFDTLVLIILLVGQLWILAALWSALNAFLFLVVSANLTKRAQWLRAAEKPAKVVSVAERNENGPIDWAKTSDWPEKRG